MAKTRTEVQSFLESKLGDDPTLVPFLMKGLHREKEGGYSWRFNVKILADTLDTVTEGIDLSLSTIPTLFIRGLKSSYVSDEELERVEQFYMRLETLILKMLGTGFTLNNRMSFSN